jgi:hypothetical protein
MEKPLRWTQWRITVGGMHYAMSDGTEWSEYTVIGLREEQPFDVPPPPATYHEVPLSWHVVSQIIEEFVLPPGGWIEQLRASGPKGRERVRWQIVTRWRPT